MKACRNANRMREMGSTSMGTFISAFLASFVEATEALT
jgi:hypothetical protein